MRIATLLLLATACATPAPATRAATGSAELPNVIAAPLPDYPVEALRRRLTGTAVVVLDIDPKTGKVGRVQLRQATGNRLLDRLTLRAFTKWQFQPGTVTRLAVPVQLSPRGVIVSAAIDPDRPYPFSGTLKAVDLVAKTLTVRGPRGTDVIAITAETKLSRNGRPVMITDASAGSEVRGIAKVTTEMRATAVSVEL